MSGRSGQQPESARVPTRIRTAVPVAPASKSGAGEQPRSVVPRTDVIASLSNASRPASTNNDQHESSPFEVVDRPVVADVQPPLTGAAPAGISPSRMLLLLAAMVFAVVVVSPLLFGSDDDAATATRALPSTSVRQAAASATTPSVVGPAVDADQRDAATAAWDAGVAGVHEDIRRKIGNVISTTVEVYAVPQGQRTAECARLADQMADLNAGLGGTVSIDAAWGLALNESSDWLGLAVSACGTTRDLSAGSHVHSAQRALERADARVAELDRLRASTLNG